MNREDKNTNISSCINNQDENKEKFKQSMLSVLDDEEIQEKIRGFLQKDPKNKIENRKIEQEHDLNSTSEQERQQQAREKELFSLVQDKEMLNLELQQKNNQVQELEMLNEELIETLKVRERELETKEYSLLESEKERKQLIEKLENKESKLEAKEHILLESEIERKQLIEKLENKEKELEIKERSFIESEKERERLIEKLEDKERELEIKERSLLESEKERERLIETLEERVRELDIQDRRLEELGIKYTQLERGNNELQEYNQTLLQKFQQLEQNVKESYYLYSQYQQMSGSIREELNGLFKGDTFEHFLVGGGQSRNLDMLFEIAKKYTLTDSEHAPYLVTLFDYFFKVVNQTYEKPLYEPIEVEIGEGYNPSRHLSTGKASGEIVRILLNGYQDRNGTVQKKTIVQL